MTLTHIVGARPNFMKAAPVLAAFDAPEVDQTPAHTRQHSDREMSVVFFEELGLPKPGSHAVKTGETMIPLE